MIKGNKAKKAGKKRNYSALGVLMDAAFSLSLMRVLVLS